MRAYVLPDVALTKHAGRFAWLAIDSEKAKNTAFVEKFPVDAWPMFLVIDSKSENILLKWNGSATVPQLVRLLDDGERAFKGGGNASEAALARADRLNGEGKPAEAARAYRETIEAAGSKWPGRERAVESLVMTWQLADNPEECARAAVEMAPTLPRGRSFLSILDSGLSCATDGEKAEWAISAIAKLKPLAEEALHLPTSSPTIVPAFTKRCCLHRAKGRCSGSQADRGVRSVPRQS